MRHSRHPAQAADGGEPPPYHRRRTFCPSTNPDLPRPCRKAATTPAESPGERLLRNPIIGIGACCARAASGHTAALLIIVMNSRRLMCSPQSEDHSLNAALCITAKSIVEWQRWVISDRAEPTAGPSMSAMPRKRPTSFSGPQVATGHKATSSRLSQLDLSYPNTRPKAVLSGRIALTLPITGSSFDYVF